MLIQIAPRLLNFYTKRQFSQQNDNATDNNVNKKPHIPVMVEEAVKALQLEAGKTYIDMTFGAGGHSKKILESAPDIKLITLDRDPDSIKFAEELKEMYPGQVTPLLGRFSELPTLLQSIDVKEASIDGFLFDFGCSSMQFDQGERGFSINHNGPLDMRMDKDRFPDDPTAADVLARINEIDLYKVIKMYGEEKNAKKIARAILDVRYSFKKIETTRELASIVASCFDKAYRKDSLNRPMHMATKTFQALRIFVNNELNEINHGLHIAEQYLKANGRLAAITFHSLEDTIVKRHIEGNLIQGLANPTPLRYLSHLAISSKEEMENFMESNWKSVYKHVLIPTEREIDENPRSRSAKLRAAIKLN